MKVFHLDFKLAFDKNLGLELFVFKRIYYDKSKKIFFSSYLAEHMINPIGSFLLMFLNTDFEEFLYLKYTLLKNLRLPYDTDFFKKIEEEAEFTPEDIQEIRQDEKNFLEDKSIKYNETEINGFMEKLNIKFETFDLIFVNIDVNKYNIPYYFESDDIFGIIALIFKEFMSDNHNTIRQCQNCGYYFVPSNLKETKYCNVEYKNTGKTCRQIGKELAYKKSLKEDTLLDKYRKRYMSLAGSVSHYGTDTAIARFEKYKKDGAVIKQKYLNKEITPKEFEKWISDSKKQNR